MLLVICYGRNRPQERHMIQPPLPTLAPPLDPAAIIAAADRLAHTLIGMTPPERARLRELVAAQQGEAWTVAGRAFWREFVGMLETRR